MGDEKVRILVVDDDAHFRFLVRLVLEGDGHFEVVGEAADGAEGVELVQDTAPEAVLLDLTMPRGTGGAEALPRIRRAAPEAKIIVLTASASDEMARQVTEWGADGYVQKHQYASTLRLLCRLCQRPADLP